MQANHQQSVVDPSEVKGPEKRSLFLGKSFLNGLSKLSGDEQKAVKTSVFELITNQAHPALKFHRLDGAKDRNFWSARANRDIRIIVHMTAGSMLLCYVDHHDEAYNWAARRKVELHPTTGAIQIVEVRELVTDDWSDGARRQASHGHQNLRRRFSKLTDGELLAGGVPPEWISEVRAIATEDELLLLCDHLPNEAGESLILWATRDKASSRGAKLTGQGLTHPDMQRTFVEVHNKAELERALSYPWEQWSIFLHPAQRSLVESHFNGPARVSGSAGTGKTIVAVHRAVFLARSNDQCRVLLTTFTEALARALRWRLRALVDGDKHVSERIEVHSLESIGRRLHEKYIGKVRFATQERVSQLLAERRHSMPRANFSLRTLAAEWSEIVDAWQVQTWEAYRDSRPLGRTARFPEAHRESMWKVFDGLRKDLEKEGLSTPSRVFWGLANHLKGMDRLPFNHVVVDEAQDSSVAQLRFVAEMGRELQDGLLLVGDVGQRIFQHPFSWRAAGVAVQGRTTNLRVNYRTSHQIRSKADSLLGTIIAGPDSEMEERPQAVSVFNGPEPEICSFDSREAESSAVSEWLRSRLAENYSPEELGVFVRSADELERAKRAAAQAQLRVKVLDSGVDPTKGFLSVATMHLAKGLEFRGVAVMACDDGVIPSQARIEASAHDSDIEILYITERHLLYVACTRARDRLLVTCVGRGSEFLRELKQGVKPENFQF